MSSLKRFLLMIALTCMWSPSFLFIKLAVEELPPITIVSLRVSLGALIFISILLWKQRKLPRDWNFWQRTSIMALFSSVLPFCLFCYAEKDIDSALAAILNGTTPMFTALLAQLFVASDRMSIQKTVGISLSSLGVVFLFAPQLYEGVSGTSVGMLAALLAALCYAISHIYGKLYTTGQQPFVAPTAQMIASSLMLWPLAFWHDQVWTLSLPSATAMFGVCGLALFGTVFAFIIYYKLLDYCGPTAISTVACFFPVGGMMLGFLFLDEVFTIWGIGASFIIILGLLTVNDLLPIESFFSKKKHNNASSYQNAPEEL